MVKPQRKTFNDPYSMIITGVKMWQRESYIASNNDWGVITGCRIMTGECFYGGSRYNALHRRYFTKNGHVRFLWDLKVFLAHCLFFISKVLGTI